MFLFDDSSSSVAEHHKIKNKKETQTSSHNPTLTTPPTPIPSASTMMWPEPLKLFSQFTPSHPLPRPPTPPALCSLVPITGLDARVEHDIGKVQAGWVNLFSASVICNKSTLFFIKWLREPWSQAERRAELLSSRAGRPPSRHSY